MRTLIHPEDWADPQLIATLRELQEPVVRHHRKSWEYAVIAMILRERGLLDGTKVGLGLGTGAEVLCFHLARHAKKIIASDLFSSTEWDCARMTPEQAYEKSPFPYPRERLEFRHMDMRKLDVPDASVDFVWSTSSVEHVDTVEDYLQVFREINRVLRPGGIAVIVTEFNLRPRQEYPKNLILVDVPLLRQVEKDSGLTVEGPLDLSVPEHQFLVPFSLDHLARIPFWDHLPNIWATLHGYLFTSAQLVFRKEAPRAPFEVSRPLDQALVQKFDKIGQAMRQLPALEPAPSASAPVVAPSALAIPVNSVADPAPLRYQVADRLNDLVKRWAGPVHRAGKELSARLLK